jgi:hypothetical protein
LRSWAVSILELVPRTEEKDLQTSSNLLLEDLRLY